MKTKLRSKASNTKSFFMLLLFVLCFNYGWSQNLMQNPTCDDHGTSAGSMGSTTDNADAYDMTPSNDILDEAGNVIPSPYQAVWDNDALEDWLEVFYLGSAGTLDEQPGSTSSGNNSRGVKLYMDTSPSLPGDSSRRIYQKVVGLTPGASYTFSVEVLNEAAGTPTEIYMLNNDIADEVGINANGGADASVDGFLNFTPAMLNNWETATLTFTASTSSVVVYMRSLGSVDDVTEVFLDNFSLEATTASNDDFIAANVKVYPNPAKNIINVQSLVSSTELNVNIYNLLGREVLNANINSTDSIDISALSQGVYLLKLSDEDGASFTRKLIVE